MHWANFLHFYQPANQQPDILEAVVAQSYRPIFAGLQKRPEIKLTINISGALFELFDKYGYQDLIDILRSFIKSGQAEFTSSAKYHAFLPFLKDEEIIRQIKINDETNRFFLGEGYRPQGFFPPEMAYNQKIAPLVASLGFKWMILDEITYKGKPGQVDFSKVYQIEKMPLLVLFRERRLSNLIMSAVVRSRQSLLEAMADRLQTKTYLLTAMDGETFGHHRPGLEKMLFAVLEAPEAKLITLSQIPKLFPKIAKVKPVDSTWASSEEDIETGAQFLSWSDPENQIHLWQWKLVELVSEEFYKMNKKHPRWSSLREMMDVALASDHFFWASGKPWWSVEMIEDGAFRLLSTIRMIPGVSQQKLNLAGNYYEKIISTAFNWQRTGKIREMAREQKAILRIPFKDRTIGRGQAEKGVYYAFLEMMKALEEKASKNGQYEEAILWRDAIFKLQNKLDIYDTINAIDLLRVKIPHKEVEETIEKYKEKYRKIRGGQPEQRGR
jgi:alpha-amylase/alpha-mannosidase (GH57 family)